MRFAACIFLLLAIGCETVDEPSRDTLSTLHGVVLHKYPSQSLESWNAGSGEYYVLDTGNLRLPGGLRSAAQGVALIPSPHVTFAMLSNYVHRLVVVQGRFEDAKPPTHTSTTEASLGKPIYRITNGMLREVGFEVAPVGAGFRVEKIAEVADY